MGWEDKEDQWTAAIKAASPVRGGRHDLYAMASEMVGNRHSKYALVDLVNWLLHRIESLAPTAPREAAKVCWCDVCGTHHYGEQCPTPTESPSTVKPSTNSGTNSESTGAKCCSNPMCDCDPCHTPASEESE